MKKSEYLVAVATLLRSGDKKGAARLVWPWMVQNEWTDRIWDHLDNHPFLCIMGHGSASKTFTSAAWFLLDWWTYPNETALIITSDTLGSMDRRIWSDVKILWQKAKIHLGGELLESKRIIKSNPIDAKNAISAVAGESDDAQSKIQGIHTKRIRVVIDEADNKYSQSIWAAISNLETSGDVRVVALANPVNKTGEFGRHCEPKEGWASINPESDFEWNSLLGWKVLRLDGLRSPNIVSGEDKFPFLLTNKGVKGIMDKGGDKSPEWWCYVRAWYPPEGSIRTIFSADILPGCRKTQVWYGKTEVVAACDPAFEGGDDCILTIGRMGRLASEPKKTVIQVDSFEKIKRANDKVPITIDFGDQIIAKLKSLGCKPSNFAIDRTGNGRGLADYIAHSWPGEIFPVEFGAKPTNLVITTEDSTTADKRFDRFVSELWYVAREWCRAGLVGINTWPRDLQTQLESRFYELLPSQNKIKVETKTTMKDRGLGSPDYGDSFCLLIHLVRTRSSGFIPGLAHKKDEKLDLLKRFRKNASRLNPTYGVREKAA